METNPIDESKMRLILASTSPRRRELFSLTGWSSEILAVEVDETPNVDEDPIAYVTRLALGKAQQASTQVVGRYRLIAADTVVINGDRILGKPRDTEDAKRILIDLGGSSHRVITALAILDSTTGSTRTDLCETVVPMRKYSAEEIDEYISGGSPMDKAGAYGIQDDGFHPVNSDAMRGCYANVMGLPLCHLTRSMKRIGLEPNSDVPAACQSFTNYHCEVFPEILRDQK